MLQAVYAALGLFLNCILVAIQMTTFIVEQSEASNRHREHVVRGLVAITNTPIGIVDVVRQERRAVRRTEVAEAQLTN